MQDATRIIPLCCLGCRVTMTAVVLVFLAYFVCAQNLEGQKECETLFFAAVKAEQQKDPIEAEFRYEECRELAQRHRLPKIEAAANHRLAVIRARNKKFSESASLFRRALELDPKNALILSDFAQLHADRKDYNEAETLLKKALDADPNNPKILFSLGSIVASQRAERQTEGLRYLKLAVGEAEAYRELARIYRSKGDISRAEFADQKAKIAEENAPSKVLATASTSNNTAGVRPAEPVQTPPEVVERVRQELLETSMRETVGTQQRSAATVLPPPMFPVPMVPPAKTAAVPADDPQPDSAPSAPPIDPFIAMVSPQESTASPVRRLESPPAATYARTAVRTIPSPLESLAAAPPSEQKSKPDSFETVHETNPPPISGVPAVSNPATNNPTTNKLDNDSPGNDAMSKDLPQSQRGNISPILSSDTAIANSPLLSCSPTTGVSNHRAEDMSVRVLPSGAISSERTGPGNPLRQIPSTDSAAPAIEESKRTLMPSFRKIPRIDPLPVQEQAASVPPKTEFQPSLRSGARTSNETPRTTESNEVARTIKHLPIRNDKVLQTPVASQPRHDFQKDFRPAPAPEKDVPLVARVVSEPSAPASSNSQSMTPNPNSRHFLSANAPNVVGFGPRVRNQSDTVSPTESAEVAERLLVRNDTLHIVSADPFPMRTESKPADATPKVIPLPLVADATMEKPQTLHALPPLQPAPVVANSFPTAVSAPLFAEVKKIEPRTQQAHPPLQPEPKPVVADPFPMAVSPPLFAEVKKIEPRTQQTQSEPKPVVADPFAVASVDTQPKFTEAKRVEPQVQPKPLAPEPKPVIADSSPRTIPLPQVVEVKKVEPQTQQKPVIADSSPRTIPLPQVAEVKKAEPQPPPKPQPVAIDPFTTVVAPPQIAEVKKVEPQAQPKPPTPKPVVADAPTRMIPPPQVAEVKKVEPQTPPKPQPVTIDPFPTIVSPPQIAEVKKVEPQAQPKPPASQPVIAEVRQPESLPKLAAASPSTPPSQGSPMPSPRVVMSDAPKPLPVTEEPAGFASSRVSSTRVAIADDPTTGFARSKK